MTRRISRSLVATSMALLAAFSTGCPGGGSTRYEVVVTKDVQYAVGNVSDSADATEYRQEPLLLDVYEPVGAEGLRPALLLVHGGNFTEGSKEKEELVEYAQFFTGRGFVAFSMDYRLAYDHPPAPDAWDAVPLSASAHAAMVDVKAAVRYIRANAEQYHIDPNLIALLGESAGAIAAVATAVSSPDDFSTDGEGFDIPAQNNPGVSPRVQAYIHLWGNADHVLTEVTTDDPPVMIVHGDEDNNLGTSFGSARRFRAALALQDVPYEFHEAEGFGHGAWEYRENLRGLRFLILDFLNEYMPGAAGDA